MRWLQKCVRYRFIQSAHIGEQREPSQKDIPWSHLSNAVDVPSPFRHFGFDVVLCFYDAPELAGVSRCVIANGVGHTAFFPVAGIAAAVMQITVIPADHKNAAHLFHAAINASRRRALLRYRIREQRQREMIFSLVQTKYLELILLLFPMLKTLEISFSLEPPVSL